MSQVEKRKKISALISSRRQEQKNSGRLNGLSIERTHAARQFDGRAVALCVCGAAGKGSKQLTGLRKDMETARDAFVSAAVKISPLVWMDDKAVDKAHLLARVRQMAASDDVQLCFLYYTGHGKRRDEFKEESTVSVCDCGGGWILAKASEAEILDQTLADLCALRDLLDEWEGGLQERHDFNRRDPPRLMILPDCCASEEFGRQLGPQGAEEARRQRLRVSLHIVSMTTARTLDDIIVLGHKLMALSS
jgi:hypothetical protein